MGPFQWYSRGVNAEGSSKKKCRVVIRESAMLLGQLNMSKRTFLGDYFVTWPPHFTMEDKWFLTQQSCEILSEYFLKIFVVWQGFKSFFQSFAFFLFYIQACLWPDCPEMLCKCRQWLLYLFLPVELLWCSSLEGDLRPGVCTVEFGESGLFFKCSDAATLFSMKDSPGEQCTRNKQWCYT